MLCDDAPLTIQQFGHNIVSPKFPAALSFLNLLQAPSLFGEYLIFSHDIKEIQHLITLVNSNAASRELAIIFIAYHRQLTEEPDRSNMSNGLNLVYARCYSSLSTKHVGCPSDPNLDLFWVQQSSAAPICDNYRKQSFDAKHLEKGLNRGW